MQRCREHKITLSSKKFVIGQDVSYVGVRITKDGTRPDPKKVEAITNFPTPANKTDLRSFFGLTNQLAPFSADIKLKASPLRGLLSTKAVWQWLPEHDQAFKATKAALTRHPVLAFFDPNRETDASRLKGLGFALMQNHGCKDNPKWKLIQCGS